MLVGEQHRAHPERPACPSVQMHLDGRKGSIQVGKDADLVVLDDNYDVLQTYCMGKAQL